MLPILMLTFLFSGFVFVIGLGMLPFGAIGVICGLILICMTAPLVYKSVSLFIYYYRK